ncbi:MAG: hypothetical protein RLZZ336_2006 [Cyanobacteriota bacterium]|jgi:hypothetical protein
MEASPLLLVVADTASQRRQLTRAVLEHRERQGHTVALVDLACDLTMRDGQRPIQRYDADAWADTIWQGLVPVLAPWLALLELEPADAERPFLGAVPGLDTVLRALYLAQCWHDRQPASTLVVVMPPLAQASEILQLLRRGPDLLEGLWSPLLTWWSQTRQRLAQFELVLRLRLPEAETLALSTAWRRRLQELAARLVHDTAPVEALLALAVDAEDLPQLSGRVAALPLCGLCQPRLWLEGELPGPALDQLACSWDLPVLHGRSADQTLAFEPWLDQPLRRESQCWLDGPDGTRCRLLLPGLVREGLRVRQSGQQLLVRSGGLQLEVPLPREWSQLTCRSARIDAPWLDIGLS